MKRIGFIVIISFILASTIVIISTVVMSKDFTFEDDDNGQEVEDNQITLAQGLMKKKELNLNLYISKSPSQVALFSLKGASIISISLPMNITGRFSVL